MKNLLMLLALCGVALTAGGCQDKCAAADNTIMAKLEACGGNAEPVMGCNADNADRVECTANCIDSKSCDELMADVPGVFAACTAGCAP